MKKRIAVLLAMILCVGMLAACGSEPAAPASTPTPAPSSEPAPAESAAPEAEAKTETAAEAVEAVATEGATVGVLVVTTQSQWCNDIIAGVTEVCDANGAKVIVSDSQVSVDNEISGMENLLNAGCSAIVVNCMNAGGLVDVCAEAQAKGVYIIGWSEMLVNYDALVVEDREAEANMVADAITAFVQSKGLESTEMATIWLADANNPDTNAGLYKAAQENVFKTRLEEGLGVKTVNSQFAIDTNAAMNAAEAILAANPNVKVLFCQSDEMGVAVAQVLQAKGTAADDVFVIGLDGTDEAIKNVADPNSSMAATVFVDTVQLGRGVGESIFTFLNEGTKGDVVTGYTLITAENAGEYVK